MLYPEIVIAGCGNPLFADDGFGPAVAEELQNFTLPDNVRAIDAGTSAPRFIFDLLDPDRTKRLIIIDTMDFGAEPGTIGCFRIKDFSPGCIHDAQPGGIIRSLHQIHNGIEYTIIGCQPKRVTYPELDIRLSDEVVRAIPDAVQLVLALVERDRGSSLNCPTRKYPDESAYDDC